MLFRKPSSEAEQRQRLRFLGWWFFAIGTAFALLAVRFLLLGGSKWLFALRLLISACFFVLGNQYWRAGQPR